MINKKWIGLFIGIIIGIFIGIMPFFAGLTTSCQQNNGCTILLTWPWYAIVKIASLLGYKGEFFGIIFSAPLFYAFIVAILGYFVGKKIEGKKN